jgi:hypothetical protein
MRLSPQLAARIKFSGAQDSIEWRIILRYVQNVFIATVAWCMVFTIQSFAATTAIPCKIIDKRTLMAVSNARVCLRQIHKCIATESGGTVLFQAITPGIYSLSAAADGYDSLCMENVLIKTGLNAPLIIEINKSTKITELDRMVVQSYRAIAKQPDQSTSMTRLSAFELANTAGSGNDINRILSTLPAVISQGTDMDNTLFVRGGQSRENVFVVDGIELDNISHFSNMGTSGGGLGFIDGAAVNGLDFYAGGIPAIYPPAISSIIDLQIREGSYTQPHYKLELNISGIGLSAEGPLWKDHLSYLLSFRYLNLKFIKGFLPLNGVPEFGDGLMKLTYRLNTTNTISLLWLGAFDKYQEFDDTDNWQIPTNFTQKRLQNTAGLTWKMTTDKFRNKLQGSFRTQSYDNSEEVSNFKGPTTLWQSYWKTNMHSVVDTIMGPSDSSFYYGQKSINREIQGDFDKRWFGALQDDFVYYLRDNDQCNIGLAGKVVSYHLAKRSSLQFRYASFWYPDTTDLSRLDSSVYQDAPYVADSIAYDSTVGGYAQYVFNQGPLKIIGGVRLDYFRLFRDYGFSPRCAFVFNAGPVGTFSLSGGLLYQPPAELSGRLYDIMVPNPTIKYATLSFSDIKLQRNWQAALGYERELPLSHTIKCEAYYKWYDREYERIRPDYFVYQKEWDDAAEKGLPLHMSKPQGKKKVYGLELFLQKQRQEGIFYSIGYSLFSSQNRYADGKWYNDENNLQNTLGLTLGARFNKHHEFSVRLAAAQGRPYCAITKDPQGKADYDPITGFFTKRLDPSFSTNVRYSFILFPKWGTVTGYIEAWNLFDYTPVIRREVGPYSYWDFKSNGIIPLVGISSEF